MTAPRGRTLVALIAALCFLAGSIGWVIGQGRPPGRDSADVTFLYGMIDHHLQAIHLSAVELHAGEQPRILTFAEEIHRFQSYEIGLMEGILTEWGYVRDDGSGGHDMPGLASEEELDGLRDAGEATDAWFVALMVDHHAGGIVMLDEVIADGDDDEVRALAARMRKAQASEIGELLRTAERLGLEVPPDGVIWDVMGRAIDESHLEEH